MSAAPVAPVMPDLFAVMTEPETFMGTRIFDTERDALGFAADVLTRSDVVFASVYAHAGDDWERTGIYYP